MHSKYLWHNFRDSRNPSPADTRLERQAQQMNLIGESSLLPNGGATLSEVNAAHRNKKEGGTKDKCKKGKACHMTCIAKGDRCLLDFPPSVQSALRQLAEALLEKSGGSVSEEEDELFGVNIASLFGLYSLSLVGKGKTGQAIYPPSVAQKYVDHLRTGKYAVTRVKVSNEELDRLWSSLDEDTRSALMIKGQPPREISRNAARGKNILRQLLETGFRDEITGQPYSWRDLQPDHKVPIALFKGDKKNVEIDNLVMVHKGFNTSKGSAEGVAFRKGLGPEFVKDKLIKQYSQQASRTEKEFLTLLGKAKDKDAGLKEMKSQLKANSKLWTIDEWARQTSSLPKSAVEALLSLANKDSKTQDNPDGLPNRWQVSRNQGRNNAPKYGRHKIMAAGMLLHKNVPLDKWPPGLLDAAVKDLKLDLESARERASKEGGQDYDRQYMERFLKFTRGNVPPELRSVFDSEIS